MIGRVTSLYLTVVVMVALNGCSHAPLGKDFNEASANNVAVQSINPQAGKDEGEVAALDGEKADGVLQRYRSDTGKGSSQSLLTNISQ